MQNTFTNKSIGQTNDEWEQNRIKFAEKHKELLPVKIKRNLTLESPIKVLLSSLFFKTFTGSEMYVYELARGLKKLNCDITVLSDIDGPLSTLANQQGIKTLPFSNPPGYKLGDGKWGMNTPQGFVQSQPNMLYKMSDVNFDIIHVQHNPISQRVCDMYPNTPKISTIHSEVIELENPFIHDSIKKYICIRPEIQKHVVDNFNIDETNTDVIYNPIDTNRFNNVNTKTYPYVLFVGTIDYLRKQTIEDLIKTTREENNELWIVGKENDDYLPNMISNQPHVKYFGPSSNVEQFIHKCDETAGILLGRTTIEGWMCGKKGWIYDVDSSGNVLSKELHDIPEDIDKFKSNNVVKEIKQQYELILD